MTIIKSRFDKKIPIAPQPKAGESLGGWYAKVSSGFAVKIHDALPVLDLGRYGGTHVSKDMIADLSKKLASMTDISTRVWRRMIEPEAKLTNMWLKYQPKTSYCFPQLPNFYCIECFMEDIETLGQTYYRVEWASPFVLSCHKHRSPLINNRFRGYDNASCKLDIDKFEGKVSYVGRYDIISRDRAKILGNYISPMARRVSDLFSLDDKVAKKALKALGRYEDLASARSAAIAVLQILSHRSGAGNAQCVGRILFAERHCKEFIEHSGYNPHGLIYMAKEMLITAFEQVGWFTCHPKNYKRYALDSISNSIARNLKSFELGKAIKKDQMVLLFALLLYFHRYSFKPDIKEYHPLFEVEWERAANTFFDAVSERYYP